MEQALIYKNCFREIVHLKNLVLHGALGGVYVGELACQL